MAIVRELITILGTEFDPKGVKEYERGIGRIKDIALEAAAAIGIVFSVEKIGEFIDGLLESGNEIKKIRAQIENVARPLDDVNEAMDRTFEIAQQVGVAYTGVADTFREFLQSSKDAKISQEELLNVTENVFKALKVDRATAEQQERLFAIINRVDVMGKASPRMIGMLQNTSISSLRLLESYFKTDEEGLRALAKAGKITFDEFTKALGSVSPELNEKFAKVPWTIGRAWIYARNQMVLGAAEFLKVTRLSIILGTAIKQLTDIIVNMFKSFFTAIGGLKNAIDVLGIAMALVLGPRMLAYLIDMVGWMWKFTAANWAAVFPWLALSAAVVGVAIAIQDLVGWMQGKKSIIGTWVGPFADLKENFGKLDIFAGFRLPGEIMRGEWNKALEDFHKLLNSTPAIILTLLPAIAAVTGAFVLWGLSGPVGAAIKAIRGVKEEIVAAETVAKGAGKAEAVVGAGAGKGKPLGLLGNIFGMISAVWLTNKIYGAVNSASDWVTDFIHGPGRSEEINKMREKGQQQFLDFLSGKSGPQGRIGPEGTNTVPSVPRVTSPTNMPTYDLQPPLIQAPPPPPIVPSVPLPGNVPTITVRPISPTNMPTYDLPTSLPPGAMGRPASTTNNDNKQITVTQTNNVTVQVQDDAGIASRIATSISNYTGELISGIARDLGRSSPRTEAATQ